MVQTPALPVSLDRDSPTPLAVQLAEELRAAAGDRRLRHGGGRGRGAVGAPPPAEAGRATAGTSGAVAELAAAVLRPGDLVAVEEPGYQRAVGALRAAGLRIVPAPVDADGLLVDSVPAAVPAVYCSPAHQ